MKILVCMKQVPQKDAPLKLNERATWVREDVGYEVNEPDAYALEEALRQKEAHGGEVVAITAGPARAQQVLREALAKGADRAIHLEDERFVALDTLQHGARAGRGNQGRILRPDLHRVAVGRLRLCADRRAAGRAAGLAARHHHHADGNQTDGGIRVKRELESGFFQYVEMPLPAVLTIQSGINKLRYATLIGIKQAKNKPLRKVSLAEVESALKPNQWTIERLYVPQKTKHTEVLQASAQEVAKKLVAKLRDEMRVIWGIRKWCMLCGTERHCMVGRL